MICDPFRHSAQAKTWASLFVVRTTKDDWDKTKASSQQSSLPQDGGAIFSDVIVIWPLTRYKLGLKSSFFAPLCWLQGSK